MGMYTNYLCLLQVNHPFWCMSVPFAWPWSTGKFHSFEKTWHAQILCLGEENLSLLVNWLSNCKSAGPRQKTKNSTDTNKTENSPCMLITSSWDNRSGWLVIDLWRDDSTLFFFLVLIVVPQYCSCHAYILRYNYSIRKGLHKLW